MKILMLGWELPPYNSGGLGVACYELAKSLSQDGVSIEFAVPYTADHAIDEFEVISAPHLVPHELSLQGVYDSAHWDCNDEKCSHVKNDLRSLQRHYTSFIEKYVIKNPRPDVIHAHDWLTFEAALRAKALTGAQLIAHVHATEFDRSGEHHGNPLVHEIEYNGLLMADRIIAVSQITKELIVKEYGIDSAKISVLHNAITPSDIIPDEPLSQTYAYLERMKREGYTVVVSLGRLTVQKGLRYFLEAAAQAVSRHQKLLFLIAGNGEQRDELIQLSAELGIAEKVFFTGFVRGKQWRDAYAIGDVFVMSSVSEPFGLTALEAAGYGSAIVLTKQSGVSEVLRSVLAYDYWDTTRLATQLVGLAREAPLRDELISNAHLEFSRLSWRDAAQKCAHIYAQAGAIS